MRRTATTTAPAARGRSPPCPTTASARWGLPTGAASQVRAHDSTPTCGADASLLSSPPAPGRVPAPCPDWFVSPREGPASASAPPSDGAGWVCAGGLPKSSQRRLPAPRACSIPPSTEAKHCAAVQTHARPGAELQAARRHPGCKRFLIPRAPQACGVAPALCRGCQEPCSALCKARGRAAVAWAASGALTLPCRGR